MSLTVLETAVAAESVADFNVLFKSFALVEMVSAIDAGDNGAGGKASAIVSGAGSSAVAVDLGVVSVAGSAVANVDSGVVSVAGSAVAAVATDSTSDSGASIEGGCWSNDSEPSSGCS
jgi:hypothetical protein